jgi:CO/xanthine dehydrogenase FAD-binding subunit/aerobic-type carbon monoxide dehydrogenase small subunit (CoxS/CutS family)
VLARGIRSYHRPSRIEDALVLARQGAEPLAGGTRLLASEAAVPNVLDLWALDLGGIATLDSDLVLGAMVTLQDVLDSPLVAPATAGLLPAACRAQAASPLVRAMATLGGEAVQADPDAEVAAALLALNAVFVVRHPDGSLESPALRFLRRPRSDLAGGGILASILVPGAPDGAALERAAPLPSALPLVSVAATVSFAGEICARSRIAVTGLAGPPARVPEAESRIEGTPADAAARERAADQVAERAPFRDDPRASAGYRRRAARALALRALERATQAARGGGAGGTHRSRRPTASRVPRAALPYFTSGRVEISIDGAGVAAHADARTTLLDVLRREGFRSVRRGCEAGACGTCTVLLDGRPVAACLTLAARAHLRAVQTAQGLARADAPHALARAFHEEHALGCGYCTPAMVLAAKALIDGLPAPSEAEAREALAGCRCSCTGFVRPVRAALRAAAETAGAGREP